MRLLAPIVLIVSMLLLYVPFKPELPVASLDPSWSMGMNELVYRGAVFGRDVIFTFGPMASVYTTMFHPSTDSTMLLASMVLALGVAFAWAILLRGRSAWVWLGVSMSVWFMFKSRDAMLFLLPVLAALATGEWVWRRRELINEDSQRQKWELAGLILVWVGVGLLPLIKGTMLVLSLALTALTCLYVALQGFRLGAACVLLLPQVVTVLAWKLTGQPIEYLPAYLHSMTEIVKGYTEAMSSWHVKHGHYTQVLPFLVMTLFLLRLVWRQGMARGRVTALFVVLAYGMSLFVAYKAAFVRHDEGHAIAASNLLWAAVLTAVIRQPMPRWQATRWVASAFALWLTMMLPFPNWTAWRYATSWWDTQQGAVVALTDRLTRPAAIHDAYEAALARIRQAHPLPSMHGATDVYSTNQAVLLAHGLSWRPRPVLQSYSAYTPALAQLNREHLTGPAAPDTLLFAIEPIDGRMASQEDGESWPHLLAQYEPVQRARDGLILQRRNTAEVVPDEPDRVLVEREAVLGDWVTLPDESGPMVFAVRIERNALGRLMHTAFKAGPLALDLELTNGTVRRLRVVSGMLSGGVLLSPLVESTDEFALLFGDSALLADKRVKSIRLVELNRGPSQWQNRYTLTIKEARGLGQQHDAMMRVVTFQPLQEVNAADTWVDTVCDGSIDELNTAVKDGVHQHQAALLRMRGWVVHRGANGPELKKPLLTFKGSDGQRWKMLAVQDLRPDVGAHLGRAEFAGAGWKVMGDLRPAHGTMKLSVAYEDAGVVRTCSNLTVALQRP